MQKRKKVVKGWHVVANVDGFDRLGEHAKVRKIVSRLYATQQSADWFQQAYKKTYPDIEAWVESKSGFETRKDAPEIEIK